MPSLFKFIESFFRHTFFIQDYDDVLGTLSGDDTVFVLLAEGVKPLDFLPSFDSIHPNIKTLYNPEGRKKNNGAMRRRFF